MTKDVDLCRQDERRHWFFRAKRGKLYSCAKTQKPCPDDFAARLFAFRAVQGSSQPISMDFGRRISVSRPWGLTLRAVMEPPCAVTLRLAMASPRPNPVPVRTRQMHENRIDGFREQRTEYRIADQKEKSGYCSTAKKNADIFLILFYSEKKGGQKNAKQHRR